MKKVLILDANQRSALAATRSLGSRGIPVTVADFSNTSLAGQSRYCGEHVRLPSPYSAPVRYIDAIEEVIRQKEIDILLPMTDISTSIILHHRERFNNTVIPVSSFQNYDTLTNKNILFKHAKRLGLHIPRTHFIEPPFNANALPKSITYPVVIKPSYSKLLIDNQWINTFVMYAKSASELDQKVKRYRWLQTHPFMLQEYIAGVGQGIFTIYQHGTPIGFFCHSRIREKPPSGGVSVLCESVSVDNRLRAVAESLLGNLGWHGVAMVEFKIAADGTPYLMEVNARFWGSLQLAIDAGVDFPWLLYQIACGEQPGAVEHYQTGIRLRWLLGDLDSLYLSLRNKDSSIGEKLLILKRFLTPAPFKTRHEVNRWEDMGPFWWELRQYVRDILK